MLFDEFHWGLVRIAVMRVAGGAFDAFAAHIPQSALAGKFLTSRTAFAQPLFTRDAPTRNDARPAEDDDVQPTARYLYARDARIFAFAAVLGGA
ncbi:hypothetical protein [Sinorhizobium fredii]|uniref:hypothetical protein n=1 Tax=Rhizobium fredii TaxID=380 RepID=UPI000B065D67|nr:hypothetical protein [Sinorhizobium fredii]WOS66877.1 hypothetical protein SFGR64A_27375 [Sinorhizobium fredii GR64]